MIEIELTQGQVTYVDDVDADLAELKWQAHFVPSYANGGNYVVIRSATVALLKRRAIYMHRVILGRMLGYELATHEQVDHVNRNPLDNRRENLRLATVAQNNYNHTRQQNSTSGYKGVAWHEKLQRWRAYIYDRKRQVHLGLYDDPVEAAKIYDFAARDLHGEFAALNFPD